MNKLVVYEHPNCTGLSHEFTEDVPNLVALSFDNVISCLEVFGQPWAVYEHQFYRGTVRVYEEGCYNFISEFNDVISSMKLIQENLANPRITLYEHGNYKGLSRSFTQETNLVSGDMNDKASSHIVQSGVWMLYQHPNCQGRTMLAREGEHCHDYGAFDFHDRMSHIRPLKPGKPVVKKVTILWDEGKKISKEYPVDEFHCENRTASEQQFTTTKNSRKEVTISQHFTFSESSQITTGSTFNVSASFGMFGFEAGMSLELKKELQTGFQVEKGTSESKTTTLEQELSLPNKVPAMTRLKIQVLQEEIIYDIPVEIEVWMGCETKQETANLRCIDGSKISLNYSSDQL